MYARLRAENAKVEHSECMLGMGSVMAPSGGGAGWPPVAVDDKPADV